MKRVFVTKGLCCPNCASEIERSIARMDGCISAKVSFIAQRLTVEAHDEDMERVVLEARRIVRRIDPRITLTER